MPRRLSVILLLVATGCTFGVADAGESVSSLAVPPVESTTSAPPTSSTTEPATTTVAEEPATAAVSVGRPGSPRVSISLATVETESALSTFDLGPHESLAVRSDHRLPVYARPLPIEPFMTLDETTILGTPTVLRVVEGPIDGWLRVSLPVRPNGTEGWVRTEGLTLFTTGRRVEVDLSDRRLVVMDSNDVLLETSVAVGSTSSPTPVGTFFITDSVITGNDNGPWGPWAFGLSARSDVITEFNGGDGIIGIHGTNRPGSIGSAASLGCVRVPNDIAVELGSMLSAGIPVQITP